jgi:CBS domain-containing protein
MPSIPTIAAGAGIVAATDIMSALGKTAANLVVPFRNLTDVVVGFGNQIAKSVALANPAVFQQWQLAVRDLGATIGQTLTPVLQVVTKVVRLFADAISSFSGPLGAVLGEIAESLMPIFGALAEVMARVGQVLAGAMRLIAPFIKMAVDGIMTVFDWIGRAVRYLLDLIGIELGDSPLKRGASVGAAVRQAGHGSVESVIQKAQASAFSLGAASGPNYAKLTADGMSAAVIRLGSIADVVRQMFDSMQNPFKFIKDIRDILNIEAEKKELKKEGARLDSEIEKFKAQRALFDLALGTAGFGSLPKARYGAKFGDGSGTVKAE